MFIEDVKSYKKLFKKIATHRRLSKQEREQLDEIKKHYGVSDAGTVSTQDALAELMGVTSRTIIRWKKEGMPVEPDGSYDPVKVIEWRAQVSDGSDEDPELSDKGLWTTEKLKFQALMAELIFLEKQGKLISKEEVERHQFGLMLELKKYLLGRARRVSNRIANRDAKHCYEILSEDSLQILRDLSRESTSTGGSNGRGESASIQGESSEALRGVQGRQDAIEKVIDA
jgi:phage terminase Nu1 subunit (DNA packaging protein)